MTVSRMTSSEVAARLEVSKRTVVRLVERNELTPADRLALGRNGTYLFDRAEVERFAALRDERKGNAK